jgi:hypothetical protein
MGQSAIALLAFLAKNVNVIAAWATVRMEVKMACVMINARKLNKN